MLPKSDHAVFTHGDIAPRNIMVHECRATGIIDWGYADWYPDYWEYAADYEACFLGGGLVSVNGEDCTGEMGS